mmetsp:Transcript_10757/g.19912  ORF Transcript_10757/g.19912 Transcript_10757/m.19912 type:complete len:377 (-) Transcript_10757:77-1207(-)
MDGQTYTGTVKGFNPHKGWGFIECAVLGRDIFLLSHALNGTMANKGDQVSFNVEQNDKGPQAANVRVTQKAVASGSRGDFIGTVKSYNPQKGWGFIECRASHELYGRDVFLGRNAMLSTLVEKDYKVSFAVQMGPKGPEATNVHVLGDQWVANKGAGKGYGGPWPSLMPLATGGKGGVLPGKGGPDMWALQGGWPQQSPWMWAGAIDGRVFGGVVKSFITEKGFGFVSCEAMRNMFGQDVFFLKSAVAGAESVNIGENVLFTATMSAKGVQAKELWLGAQPGQTFTGAVKMWNKEKGWGFLSSEATQQMYGKDVYLHSRDTAGAEPFIGQKVQFSVVVGAKDGRPNAADVTLFPPAGETAPSSLPEGSSAVASESL